MTFSTFFSVDYTLLTIPILLIVHILAASIVNIRAKTFKFVEFMKFTKNGAMFLFFAILLNVVYTLIKNAEYGELALSAINALRLVVIIGVLGYYLPQIYSNLKKIGMPKITGVEDAIKEVEGMPKEIAETITEAITTSETTETETTDTSEENT